MGNKVVVTSEDHGHQFGLPSPVDAAEVVRQKIADSVVDRFEIDERSGDFSLSFKNGVTLQFITLSGGFEGWRMVHPDLFLICLGGGELAIHDAKPKQLS